MCIRDRYLDDGVVYGMKHYELSWRNGFKIGFRVDRAIEPDYTFIFIPLICASVSYPLVLIPMTPEIFGSMAAAIIAKRPPLLSPTIAILSGSIEVSCLNTSTVLRASNTILCSTGSFPFFHRSK